jgi:hypothetical protein
VVSGLTRLVCAYTVPGFPYARLFAASDQVVIAKPLTSPDTGERTAVRDISSVTVVGVTTECQVLFVFTGPKRARFKLHHYEWPNPRLVVGGPVGITFNPPKNNRYLMFLVRESDGRFAPVLGQRVVELILVLEVLGESAD